MMKDEWQGEGSRRRENKKFSSENLTNYSGRRKFNKKKRENKRGEFTFGKNYMVFGGRE